MEQYLVVMGQQKGKSSDKVIMVSEFSSVLRHVVDQVNLNCQSIRCYGVTVKRLEH